MHDFLRSFLIAFFVAGITVGVLLFSFRVARENYAEVGSVSGNELPLNSAKPPKTKEELIAEALDKSKEIKGIYMTAEVAFDKGAGATRLRNQVIKIAEDTEINGIVIDVKEVCGPEFSEDAAKNLIQELHQKKIWAIARIVTFKDASQIEAHPEWYLKRDVAVAVEDECASKRYLRIKNPNGVPTNAVFWRDRKGGYWLDPASQWARDYIAGVAKKVIDLGFDELQFDYVRFPSDGDIEKASFPFWNGKTPKYVVLKSFFEFLHDTLKEYKPDIILSADLFGYAAIREGDVGIGQRLEDIGNNFDYISFMVYPSHYYSGLYLPPDPVRNLPIINLTASQARMHPDIIVGRSIQFARDFLNSIGVSPSSTQMLITEKDGRVVSAPPSSTLLETASTSIALSTVRLRPWLEDFYHEVDKAAGRPYGAEKVRLQIDATEAVENHGWLLWNAANIYTVSALKKE